MSEITLLKDLVAFNTIGDKENAQINDYIENYLRGLGFKTEMHKKYLSMTYGENPNLAFVGHTDTVKLAGDWKTDPFTLTQVGDTLYGLGACDMKGGIACFLEALNRIDLSRLQRGIKVIITYDEENDFSGIEEVVADKIVLPKYILVGEPTANICMTACKGMISANVTTHGIKVHSSTPELGKSAISSMVHLLVELEEFYKREIRPVENPVFPVPYTTMNIDMINGGCGYNSVAPDCKTFMDFRTIDEAHFALLDAKLKELCEKYDAVYDYGFHIPPFDNDIPFVEDKNIASFMTEASFITGDRMILGPGPVTAHEVDEHVTIGSMAQCVDQYTDIIEKTCRQRVLKP